jgi:hypothetical protein
MSKFEYRIVEVPSGRDDIQTRVLDFLNKEGQDGWEAVSFYSMQQMNGHINMGTINKIILKRRIGGK